MDHLWDGTHLMATVSHQAQTASATRRFSVTLGQNMQWGGVSGAVQTFPSVTLGAVGPHRTLVVALGGGASVARTISGMTIGGVAASRVVRASASAQTNIAEIWTLPTDGTAINASASADIVVTASGTVDFGMGVSVWSTFDLGALVDSDGSYASSSGSSPYSLSGVDFAAGGFAVCASGQANNVSPTMNLGFSTNLIPGNFEFQGAIFPTSAATGQTLTMSWTGGSAAQRRICFAAWAPGV